MSPGLTDAFDLRSDQKAPAAIDEQIRGGVRFAGTNLWVLFFAVLVASVGLTSLDPSTRSARASAGGRDSEDDRVAPRGGA